MLTVLGSLGPSFEDLQEVVSNPGHRSGSFDLFSKEDSTAMCLHLCSRPGNLPLHSAVCSPLLFLRWPQVLCVYSKAEHLTSPWAPHSQRPHTLSSSFRPYHSPGAAHWRLSVQSSSSINDVRGIGAVCSSALGWTSWHSQCYSSLLAPLSLL